MEKRSAFGPDTNGRHSIKNSDNFHSRLPQPEQNRIAWLKLKLVPGLGNRSLLRLLDVFGSPESVLSASFKDLHGAVEHREEPLRALSAGRFCCDPEAEWAKIEARSVRMICLGDADYPANLAAIPDPPAVLFSSGPIEPRDLVSIAVVGSRYASPGGVHFTAGLCSELASSGVTVVSGFALGIDSAAHRGALRAGGRTLAVLGCGLDVNYPSVNADLAREVAAGGALVTEFPLGTPPRPGHFPARNRIISGLSLGVVVVEAAEKSGSLITARLALEQGREVFAVPGMAQSYRSAGVNRLLKQGAKLVEGAEDVLVEIRPLLGMERSPAVRGRDAEPARGRDDPGGAEGVELMKFLDQVPKHIDELAHEAKMSVQRTAALLLDLELQGLVAQLPGKYFICSGRQNR